MKCDIYFKKPKVINGLVKWCYKLTNIITCFKKEGYIYFVGLDCYRRFSLNQILYIDMVV